MPPGVAGSGLSGSGASRVHRTKPSGRGSPEATPRLNGSALQRGPGAAQPMSEGASALPASDTAPRKTWRRVSIVRRPSKLGRKRGLRGLDGAFCLAANAPFHHRAIAADMTVEHDLAGFLHIARTEIDALGDAQHRAFGAQAPADAAW